MVAQREMSRAMMSMGRLGLAFVLAGSICAGSAEIAGAQAPAPSEAAKSDAAKSDAAKADTPKADTAKKPTKAELGEMLKKCSEEADAKGLTLQKGKAEARKAYRRSCMLKNGVAPKK